MIVAILAGGMGRRLRPLTDNRPKVLVPINGKPFIDYQLHLLANQGIERVVICTGWLGGDIRTCVGDGSQYGLSVGYVHDGMTLAGTAGAIRQARSLLGQVFGVLYGDVYPLYSLRAVSEAILGTGDAVMAVRSPGRGNVKYVDGQVLAYARGSNWAHGDAGFSVFNANAFTAHPQTDLGDMCAAMASCGELDGYEVHEPVYEIGSFEGLGEFERYVLHG